MVSLSAVARSEGVLYGVLLIIGGIVGWTKKRSTVSLIAGSVSGVLVLTSVFLSGQSRLGFFGLAGIALALLAVFFNRYVAGGGKFMPAGLMTLVSGGSFLLYLTVLVIS